MKVIYPDLTDRPFSLTVERAMQAPPASSEVIRALEERSGDASPLVREHVAWALTRQRALSERGPHRGA